MFSFVYNLRSIPVGLRITKAVANSDSFIIILFNTFQHILDQSLCSVLMNIMGDNQKVLRIRRSPINLRVVVILGIYDEGWAVIVVIVGVHVKVDDVIAQIGHRSRAGASARGVWGAHVCRELPNDIADGRLVIVHLVSAVGFTECREVWVGPSMRSNLMAFAVHAFNQIAPLLCSVDGAFAKVVSSNEKRSLSTVCLERIQHLTGVYVRAIIKSQGNRSRHRTAANILPISDIPNLSSRDTRS